MITIKDVAKEAKVAISTVSNVINNVDVVSDETRLNVLAAIEKLNYIPNLNGKFLKVSKTNVIGVFLTCIEGSFYSTLLHAMHMEALKLGYRLTIFLNDEKNSEQSFKAILGNGIDGAIVLNKTITDEHISFLKSNEIPIIFLDREIDEKSIKSVVIDNFSAVKQAIKYLIKLGHNKIGYIHGSDDNYDEKKRFEGYIHTLNEHNITENKEFEILGHYSEIGAYSALRNHIAMKKKLPEAFVCANDEMAIGAIKALIDEGFSVPKDISIIGFDNIEKCDYFTPTITSIDTNTIELSKKSIKNLVKLINKEDVDSEKVSAMLMIRNSCDLKL